MSFPSSTPAGFARRDACPPGHGRPGRGETASLRLAGRAFLLAAAFLLLVACNRPYRIGEYVWVEWEEGAYFPAYIVQKKSPTRYRVHFEGYESRWDEDVTLDRIRGRIDGPVTPPPPPKKVQLSRGQAANGPDGKPAPQPLSAFSEGDRVRVRWRGSIYSATVIAVVASDRVLVHYEGLESAWDEVVTLDRIVSKL